MRPSLIARGCDNSHGTAENLWLHRWMHDDRASHHLFQCCPQRRLSRTLTSSCPADCKGATPANILVIVGAVPTAALALSASGSGPLRVKKRASPIGGSIKVRVASVGAAERPAHPMGVCGRFAPLCAPKFVLRPAVILRALAAESISALFLAEDGE